MPQWFHRRGWRIGLGAIVLLLVLCPRAVEYHLRTRLASTRPADFSVEYISRNHEYDPIEYYAASSTYCVYRNNLPPFIVDRRCSVSPADLDRLYTAIHDNAFDQIWFVTLPSPYGSYCENPSKRHSFITVTAQGQMFRHEDPLIFQHCRIILRGADQYNAVYGALWQLLEQARGYS